MKRREDRNNIQTLVDEEGNLIQDEGVMRRDVVEYFTKLYNSGASSHRDWEEVQFRRKVSEADNLMLRSISVEDEIKKAVWGIGSNKSPVPDGFNSYFYKRCWEIIKVDLVSGSMVLSGWEDEHECKQCFYLSYPKEQHCC